MTTTKTKTQSKISIETVEAEYASILEQEKALAARKEELKSIVHKQLDRSSEDHWGRFRLSTRRSYHWEVAVLKTIFGKEWSAYVVADDKMLRVKAESMPVLLSNAAVTEVQALVFSK